MNNISHQIDIRRFIRAAKKYWWMYVTTLIIMLGAASFYACYRMPAFDTTATMLIEDSTDSSSGGALSNLLGRSFSIGGFGSSSVSNEIFVLDSHDVMIDAARNLKLNRLYLSIDGLNRELLYPDSPVELVADEEYFDTLAVGYSIKLKIAPDGSANIRFVRGRFFPKTLFETKVNSLPFVSNATGFPVLITTTPFFEKGKEYNLTINVNSNEEVAAQIVKDVFTETPDKLADAIQLSYIGPNKEFNKMLLNGLLEEYNRKRVNRRREIAKREVDFLDARLAEQLSLLTSAEKEIEDYKTTHKLSDISEEMKILVGQSVESEKELLALKSSRDYYRQVLESLRADDKGSQLIPVSEELSTPLIDNYNSLMLQRKQLALSATPDNTALKILESNLKDLRSTIEKNAEGTIEQSTILINSIVANTRATEGRLNRMPAIERKFFELTRDSQLQNELYLFLTEKRENAMLKYQSNSTLGFVVEQAYCALKPSKKKTYIAFGVALIFSIIFPTLLILYITYRKDYILSPIDMNFDNLELHSLQDDDLSGCILTLRRLILDTPNLRNLYTLNYSSIRSFGDDLLESLKAVDIPTEIVNCNSNDRLLSRSFVQGIKDSESKFLIIPVPQKERIQDLRSLINADNAVLIIILPKGQIRRSAIKRLINSGIDSAHIFTIILP